MPFVKKEDSEATDRLIQHMAENEIKANARGDRWRMFAVVLAILSTMDWVYQAGLIW
tara:strand:+ start:1490 stop:1660 length:171 start_codon:yes stop_codon:yes gene_type:complete